MNHGSNWLASQKDGCIKLWYGGKQIGGWLTPEQATEFAHHLICVAETAKAVEESKKKGIEK